jgi:signal peptidase I
MNNELLNDNVDELRDQAIFERAQEVDIIHENLVVVQKIDIVARKTTLVMDARANVNRLGHSYYGKILKISDVDTEDSIAERKKTILKVGDIVQFNPQSGYSLNIITPEDFPEIWIIGVDNILCRDTAVDLAKMRAETEKRRSEIIPVKKPDLLVPNSY